MESQQFLLVSSVDTQNDETHTSSMQMLPVEGFSTLAQTVFLSGKVPAPPLCSGMSLCGRCRMLIKENAPTPLEPDIAFFSPEQIANGWRLGCRHTPIPGMVIEVPPSKPRKARRPLPAMVSLREEDVTASEQQGKTKASGTLQKIPVSLAIDLGTTSLHWMLVNDIGKVEEKTSLYTASNHVDESGARDHTSESREETTPLAVAGSMLNPQMGAGSDVVSRLAVARNASGKTRLSQLVVTEVEELLQNAEEQGYVVQDICLAANTAMTAIALDKEVDGLVVAPYSLPFSGGSWEHVASLPPVWIPPQLSPFVGGDISSGYAAIALAHDTEKLKRLHAAQQLQKEKTDNIFPFLLADMGTNGEFILALSPDRAFTASVALGPALEGIGLSCGTEAREGAITSFSLTPMGLEAHFYTNAHEAPQSTGQSGRCACGITGTGYLSLLKRLLAAGAISKEGRFTGSGILARFFKQLRTGETKLSGVGFSRMQGVTSPQGVAASLVGSLPTRCKEGKEPYLPLPHALFLTATDVEELLKVKAAFSLGLTRLLDVGGITIHELSGIYLAGALGEHIDTEALEATGFLPQGAGAKVRVAGNTSLIGAALLARDTKLQEELLAWSKKVTPLDLAQDKLFLQGFSSHMTFSWKA